MCLILWEISLSNTSSQGISSLFGFEKGKPIEDWERGKKVRVAERLFQQHPI